VCNIEGFEFKIEFKPRYNTDYTIEVMWKHCCCYSNTRCAIGTWFGGMTHSELPSWHAIIEESPSEDDSALSEGESYCSLLLRACRIVIPARARTPTPPLEVTSASQAAAARLL
jgi:hypothetical protein